MKSTGKFDVGGNEIFVGDKVMFAWMWLPTGKEVGKVITCFKYHTITEKEAYMGGDNKMRDDGGGVIFCLGTSYNSWEGKQVVKLPEEDLEELKAAGIDEEKLFHIEDHHPVITSFQKQLCMTDEEYKQFNETHMKREAEIFWGKQKN